MSILPRCICDPLDAMASRYDARCARHAYMRKWLAEQEAKRAAAPKAAEYRPAHGAQPDSRQWRERTCAMSRCPDDAACVAADRCLGKCGQPALARGVEVVAPSPPTNEELEALWEQHQGHPADFGAAVLERWGGWQAGLLGHGGSLPSGVPGQLAADFKRVCEGPRTGITDERAAMQAEDGASVAAIEALKDVLGVPQLPGEQHG